MIDVKTEILDILKHDDPEKYIPHAKAFAEMMLKYNCALKEVTTKFQVLNDEFNVRNNRNPVETIKTRLKKPASIIEKAKRRNVALTIEDIQNNIYDIAGARIICSFPEDIYTMANMFAKQDDVTIFQIKDYIKNPKENGYRSLHLIVEVPIFLSDKKENVKVEVQFRTIAMDFWASIEHKLKYKKNIANSDAIQAQLRKCADDIAKIDLDMEKLHKEIEIIE